MGFLQNEEKEIQSYSLLQKTVKSNEDTGNKIRTFDIIFQIFYF